MLTEFTIEVNSEMVFPYMFVRFHIIAYLQEKSSIKKTGVWTDN